MPAQESLVGPQIVVGIDGSGSSDSALRWAIQQAGLTGAAVDAVTAGFAGALLGSVSQHCVQHAPCLLVVVRGPDPA